MATSTVVENIEAAARRRFKENCPSRIRVWAALLNTRRELWRGFLIDVDKKIIISSGPLRQGRTEALNALRDKLKRRKKSA